MNRAFSGANLNNIKEMNISAVLKTIFEHKGISRTDIALSTEMSCAFVTKVLSNLIDRNIVFESKNSAIDRGRPKVSLSFNYERYAMVGLRINARYVSAALCSPDGELMCHYLSSVENEPDAECIYERCCELIEKSLKQKGDRIVLGIGIAAPGPLPFEHDKITEISEENFRDFKNIPIVKRLEERFGVSVLLMHDAHCGALNEYIFSTKDERYRNIVFVATDNGVGAGIILDGKPYNGSGFAGEISNMVFGNNLDFRTLGDLISQSTLIKTCNCSSMDELILRVEDGDKLCCEHFDIFIKYLSAALSNFIVTVSPEAIVISDKIAMLPERVMKVCNETIDSILPVNYRNSAEIIVSPCSKHSVLRGACGAVLHRALEKPCEYFNL